MESSLDVRSLEKPSQLSVRRHFGKEISPPGAMAAWLPPHDLLCISRCMCEMQVLGGHTQQSRVEMRGTR